LDAKTFPVRPQHKSATVVLQPLSSVAGRTYARADATGSGQTPITGHTISELGDIRPRASAWLEARSRELLPTGYVHVVFTLPAQLAPLALQNKREIYGLLFRASADTLLQVARDERHLAAEIGFFSVLHTWNQKLLQNPHS
jgi:hypothetical protein